MIGGSGGPVIYLSNIIWPSDTSLDDDSIEFIEIKQLDRKRIEIAATRAQEIKKKSVFEDGKDFSIDSGLINIKRDGGMAGLKAGEPMLGVYYENITLGLDKSGHGKYRSSAGAAGMVFMVIPIVMDIQDDVRFERVR